MDWISENRNKVANKNSSKINGADDAGYMDAGNDDFTVYTIDIRFPKIYRDNNLGEYDVDGIVEFTKKDFLDITPEDYIGRDQEYSRLVDAFLAWLSPYVGMKTRDFYHAAPFILVEHYFYFNILRGLGLKKDPYLRSKLNALVEYREDISHILTENIKRWGSREQVETGDKVELIRSDINNCTSGNTTDLSQDLAKRRLVYPKMLKDHTDQFLDYIGSNPVSKVDILVDNTGIELLSDLILSLDLIDCGYAKNVYLRVKELPVYVSDVIVSEYGNDVRIVTDEIRKYNTDMQERFSKYIADGRIVIKPDMFWNMPNDFKNYHELFRGIIGRSDLVIVKGDLNFRRLIEDKKWACELKLDRAASYFTYPLLVLRTIKSSSVIEIPENEKEKIGIVDKTNGTYGTILFKE